VEAEIVVLLAGPAAQRRFKPRSWRSYHGVSDHERAVDLAMAVCSSEIAVSTYVKWLEIMADDEVAASWDLIERTARELFERRTFRDRCLLPAAASLSADVKARTLLRSIGRMSICPHSRTL
jgi:hypothetical protein